MENRKSFFVKLFALICALTVILILVIKPNKETIVSSNETMYKSYEIKREAQEFKKDILTGRMSKEQQEHAYYSVIIDNISAARPQYGLSMAPLVYELPAEGGITRFLAIFDSTEIEKIGPVRSARPYFIDKAKEHGLILVHCGGSPEALLNISQKKYPDMDELRNGNYFFRDNKRSAPNNLFVESQSIIKYAKARGYSLKSVKSDFDFTYEIDENKSSDGTSWRLSYTKSYNVSWKYDASSNKYMRYMKGNLHVDELNKEVITASNVIVQYISYKVLDSVGRLELSSANSGKGLVLTSGDMIECKWVVSKSGITEYFDMSGEKIKFTPGNTWVQAIVETGNVLTIIEKAEG